APWTGMKPQVPPGAVQIQGPPAPGGSRSPQMSGASVQAAPAQDRSSTQMFGAVAAPAAAAAPSPATGRSGPKLPPAAAPSTNRESTQMFGMGSPPPASGPRATQMFGGVSMPAAAPTP